MIQIHNKNLFEKANRLHNRIHEAKNLRIWNTGFTVGFGTGSQLLSIRLYGAKTSNYVIADSGNRFVPQSHWSESQKPVTPLLTPYALFHLEYASGTLVVKPIHIEMDQTTQLSGGRVLVEDEGSVSDPDPCGSVLKWFPWIRIWIRIGNTDPDPGQLKWCQK